MGETVKEQQNKKSRKPVGTGIRAWFKGLKAEFAKIIWPDKQTLTKETTAVLLISVLLGIIISVVDFAVRAGIEFLIK